MSIKITLCLEPNILFVYSLLTVMADHEEHVAQAQEAYNKQGDTVRSLKALLKEGKGDKVTSTFRFYVRRT